MNGIEVVGPYLGSVAAMSGRLSLELSVVLNSECPVYHDGEAPRLRSRDFLFEGRPPLPFCLLLYLFKLYLKFQNPSHGISNSR